MSEKTDFLELETKVVDMLKNVYDPEIPVNVYDLGLIYNIDIDDNKKAHVTMTLTAPNCPMADYVLQEVHDKVNMVEEIKETEVTLTFEPPWDQHMMSEEAKLELGML
jgi:FeS assembly SUF system protein